MAEVSEFIIARHHRSRFCVGLCMRPAGAGDRTLHWRCRVRRQLAILPETMIQGAGWRAIGQH